MGVLRGEHLLGTGHAAPQGPSTLQRRKGPQFHLPDEKLSCTQGHDVQKRPTSCNDILPSALQDLGGAGPWSSRPVGHGAGLPLDTPAAPRVWAAYQLPEEALTSLR